MNGDMTLRSDWLRALSATGVFILITVAMTYPLIGHLDDLVLGPPQDNYYYLSWFSWLRHSIVDLGQPSTINPNVFYPYGHDFTTSETTWANVVLTLPVLLGWGAVPAFNMAVLLSFVLSGLGMYILVVALTGNWWAGLLSGLIYAFAPYRMAHLGGGQLPLLGTQWLPLCLWAIERLLHERRWAWGLLIGLFFALNSLSSWYYAFMGGLLLPIYALVRARPWSDTLSDRRIWFGLAAVVTVSGILVAPAALPMLQQGDQAEMSYSLQWVDRWSASPADYVLPNVMNTFWGERTSRFYQGQRYFYERILYVGLVPLLLAVVACLSRLAGREPLRHLRQGLLWMGGAAWTLSLGTTLHWRGVDPLHIPVPGNLDQVFTRLLFNVVTRFSLNKGAYHWAYERAGHIVLPLPAMLLYLYMPFSNAMRVWSRFGWFVMLAVSILAGLGLAALAAHLGQRRDAFRALAVLAALAVLIEFAVVPFPFGFSQVAPQPATAWLSQQGGQSAVMELPLSRAMNGPTMYAERLHGQPIAYGYGTFFPQDWLARWDDLQAFPSQGALDALRQWNVRYVMVAVTNYGDRWPRVYAQLQETPALRLVGVFPEQELYRRDRWFISTRGTALPFAADTILMYELLPGRMP